jgi:hypothetical protein
MTHPTCTIDGCEKPSRNKSSAAMCPMHYHRWYRHQDPTKTQAESDVSVSLGRRYLSRYQPTHPLAMKGGKVYVHRTVLYDAIGPGPHACHWCGTEVDWLPKADPRELQPDHLNNDGADNRPANLVPSCRSCNSTRGSQRRADALRAAGWWAGSDTISRLASGGRVTRVERRAS